MLIPGLPLVPVLFLTQVLNAVLLLPLLFAMRSLARKRELMADFANGRLGDLVVLAAHAIVVASVLCLVVAALA